MKRIFVLIIAAVLVLSFGACGVNVPADRDDPELPEISENQQKDEYTDAIRILLSENGADFSDEHAGRISVGGEIIYYHDTDIYESGNIYGEGAKSDKHTAEEAEKHTLITIKEPGEYVLSGKLYGQIAVDLGENAENDPDAKVTLIFDGAEITCDIAPAVIFYNVYEAGEAADTFAFGANIIIADGSVNNINGAYVAKIYKDSEEEEKLHKYDGAVYSKMSMSIGSGSEGTGVLNIKGANEGLGSEMHLTINGGNISIVSADDGINANEDGVSVITFNGGTITVKGGTDLEGDGIDSNGSIVINGGTLFAFGNGKTGDCGIDADLGIAINGGTVAAFGSRSEAIFDSSEQTFVQLDFSSMREAGSVIRFVDKDGDGMTAQSDREYQSVVLSGENLEKDKIYYLYVDDVLQEYLKTEADFNPVPNPGMEFDGRGGFGEIEDEYLTFPSGFEEWLRNAEDIPEEIKEWLEELYRTKRRPDAEIPPQPKPDTEIMGDASFGAGFGAEGSLVSAEEMLSSEFVITNEVKIFSGISDSMSDTDK